MDGPDTPADTPAPAAEEKRSDRLSSSAIPFAEYDPETEEMTVTFVNGQSYTTSGVSLEDYLSFIRSPSPGRTYNSVFRGR